MPQEASASARVSQAAEAAAFELKGAVSPLTVLRLRSVDLVQIEVELWDRVEKAPRMLLNAPVVVDVGALETLGHGTPRCGSNDRQEIGSPGPQRVHGCRATARS